MPIRQLGTTVFDAAVQRLEEVYSEGHRMVISFSAGKDSGVLVELAKIAAKRTRRLPVEVLMRDEEILLPGSFEYAERVANDPEVDFHWIYACQPIINVFNRKEPYFWVFDPELSPEQWVRTPPAFAYRIPEIDIKAMTIPKRFPPKPGRDLFSAIGIRTQESSNRMMGVVAQRGPRKQGTSQFGERSFFPIYDWRFGDVWHAIHEHGWDYNKAYDVMLRQGVKPSRMRIAPLSMTVNGAAEIQLASRVWPNWFDRVCLRLPGMRSVALFGRRVLQAQHYSTESWQQTYRRECIEDAPAWIAERAEMASDIALREHRLHSAATLPDHVNCPDCHWGWRRLVQALFNGDPFSQLRTDLPYVHPEFFRPGSGRWDSQAN